ncbi:MAG TPA: helix-turn-helix domain-containing protein [Armatimonadaceae bacterium]|nr:helix-turn-helix domain-containing protein [Armatimonadaceae bacterium]
MYLDGSRKNILAWVEQGLSDQAIADRLRVSRSTVRYWRERNGVTRPPRGGRAAKPDDKAKGEGDDAPAESGGGAPG